MTNSVNLDSWLPMPEVIAATGMSQRTIYRMVTEGKLRQASRPIPGRRPLPVFDPADVATLAQSTLRALPQIMPPLAESRQDPAQQAPPMEFWEALIDAIRERPAMLPPAAETLANPEAETAERLARLRQQMIVTHAEAKELGFTPAILSRAVKTGKIERLPGNRYRVRELLEL